MKGRKIFFLRRFLQYHGGVVKTVTNETIAVFLVWGNVNYRTG